MAQHLDLRQRTEDVLHRPVVDVEDDLLQVALGRGQESARRHRRVTRAPRCDGGPAARRRQGRGGRHALPSSPSPGRFASRSGRAATRRLLTAIPTPTPTPGRHPSWRPPLPTRYTLWPRAPETALPDT